MHTGQTVMPKFQSKDKCVKPKCESGYSHLLNNNNWTAKQKTVETK